MERRRAMRSGLKIHRRSTTKRKTSGCSVKRSSTVVSSTFQYRFRLNAFLCTPYSAVEADFLLWMFLPSSVLIADSLRGSCDKRYFSGRSTMFVAPNISIDLALQAICSSAGLYEVPQVLGSVAGRSRIGRLLALCVLYISGVGLYFCRSAV